MTEMAKCRERLLPYCTGNGIDVGCGREKLRPEAIGIDRRSFPHVNLQMDAGGRLPFDTGALDYVFSSHFLEHLPDTRGALIEWLRVLKPGGHLVLYLPSASRYTVPNPEHLVAFELEDVVGLLTEIGGCVIIHQAVDAGPDRYSFEIVARKA